jgi:peptidoglycan/xylan/chitin deacetylase (PgdA/CDA1 family)
VEYIRAHYNVIGAEHLMDAIEGDRELPPRAALLTFDDGYADHFTNVFPVLDDAGLPGCFFPPVTCITDQTVLDVNKIHYILAVSQESDDLVDRIFQMMEAWGGSYDLQSRDAYWDAVSGDHRFDEQSVVFVKRMLQRELPEALRTRILDRLFETYVDVSEDILSRELYMSVDQLRCLRRHGMYIGGHGDTHCWMDRCDADTQRQEIRRSLDFLGEIGTSTDRWIMCYPYGAHDETLRRLLRKHGCVAGLATGPDIADLESDDPLALARLDTNDLPKNGAASPNSWTQQVLADPARFS